jgi:hypothetical protein
MHTLKIMLISLLLTGCTTVPVSTMMKFSTFDDEDFAKLNAEDIRALITVSNNAPVNVSRLKLELSIGKGEKKREYLFPIHLLSKSNVAAEKGWFSEVPESTLYTLELTEEGIKSFKEVQRIGRNKGQKFNLNLFLSFSKLPKDYEEVVMTLAMVLDKNETPVILFDQATLEQAVNN